MYASLPVVEHQFCLLFLRQRVLCTTEKSNKISMRGVKIGVSAWEMKNTFGGLTIALYLHTDHVAYSKTSRQGMQAVACANMTKIPYKRRQCVCLPMFVFRLKWFDLLQSTHRDISWSQCPVRVWSSPDLVVADKSHHSSMFWVLKTHLPWPHPLLPFAFWQSLDTSII